MAKVKILSLACVASEGAEQRRDVVIGPFCEKETSVRAPLRRSMRVDVGVGVMKEDVFQIACQCQFGNGHPGLKGCGGSALPLLNEHIFTFEIIHFFKDMCTGKEDKCGVGG